MLVVYNRFLFPTITWLYTILLLLPAHLYVLIAKPKVGFFTVYSYCDLFCNLQLIFLYLYQRRQNDFALRRGSKLDPNNLTFKFQVTLDIWEEDGKRSYQMVARDKTHFKLKRDLQRKVVVYIEQITNRRLRIER